MIFLFIFELLHATLFSSFVLIGFGCFINKLGDFLKILEEEEKDNFSKAFDKLTNESVSEFNKIFSSSHIIILKSLKMINISYELFIGEKVIKKTKDGNIVISDKSALMEKYESKIESLEKKIAQYKEFKKDEISSSEDEEEEVIEEEDD